jgi:pyruvate/2-oxoglutarate dehydrogenase complex dihydrolipoamide dehydrogenase (E3) component
MKAIPHLYWHLPGQMDSQSQSRAIFGDTNLIMNNENIPPENSDEYDVVVIGGGPAGVTAALRASELGAKVALVERSRMGGTCTNDGCVPTRVLAKAARLIRDLEQCPKYGIEGVMPVLDFEQLLNRTQQVVYQIQEKKQLQNHLRSSGVDLFAGVGDASFVNEHTVRLVDGAELRAKKFILCVGGHPRRLSLPGSELALTHSDVWSLKSLPRSVIIVGAAATGCQLASIFHAFGTEVHLMEVSERILHIEDEAISQEVQSAFERRGMKIHTNIGGIDQIKQDEDSGEHSLVLHYHDQAGEKTLQAEAVIFAVGWVGNIEALNLSAAGVVSERGYIPVDDYLRTSRNHIFAAGDVTGSMMLVQSGSAEGRIAAENAVLGSEQRFSHLIVPHGGFTDPEYASVGLTEKQLIEQEITYTTATIPYADLDRAVIDDHARGCFKFIVSDETHRILGAHVVGEQAVEVVQIVAAGMAADMWVEQLAEMELAYPTFTAIIGLAARQIVRQLGVVPLAPQWRALGKVQVAEWERSDS